MSDANGHSVFVRLAQAANRKDELKSELSALEKEIKELGQQALEVFAMQGIDSVTLRNEGRNIHLKRNLAAKWIGDRHEALEVLKRVGLDDLVTESANLNTLRSHFRQAAEDLELPDDRLSEALPEELREHLELYTYYEAGVTKLPQRSAAA